MDDFDVIVFYRQCGHPEIQHMCNSDCHILVQTVIEIKDITTEMAKILKNEMVWSSVTSVATSSFIDSDGVVKMLRLKHKDSAKQRLYDFLDSVIAKPLYDVDGDKYNQHLAVLQ